MRKRVWKGGGRGIEIENKNYSQETTLVIVCFSLPSAGAARSLGWFALLVAATVTLMRLLSKAMAKFPSDIHRALTKEDGRG